VVGAIEIGHKNALSGNANVVFDLKNKKFDGEGAP
jgi:hypothetical protein